MLKNIIIINDFDYIQGGASKVAIDTANLLCNDYNVTFFSGATINNNDLDKKVNKICTNQGEALKDKNRIRGFFNGIYNIKSKKELKKLLLKYNKEETIIHIHGWTKCLSSSVFDVAWKMNYKIILTLHDYFTACPNGGYFNYPENKICKLIPMTLKCINCNCDSRNYIFKLYRILRQFVQNKIVKLNERLTDVISISEFSENILKKTLNDKVKIHRVYNPIEFDELTKENKYLVKKEDYYLYVGRVTKEKGVDIFCEAITKAKLKGIVVGDGAEKKVLESKYPSINFVGWKSKEEVKEYMKSAKAVIMPSRWYEGAPLTPLEAISNGTKCFVSNCCSAVDYINVDVGIIGFDIDNLDILELESKTKKMNNTLILKYLKKFSVEEYKKNILKIYKKMCGNE